MELSHDVVDKLQRIFEESWVRVLGGARPVCVLLEDLPANLHPGDHTREEWVWTLYMNTHDVLIITHDDLVDSFSDMVNFGSAVKESVCLLNPVHSKEFLLVPNALVEKCLALGTLA